MRIERWLVPGVTKEIIIIIIATLVVYITPNFCASAVFVLHNVRNSSYR